ncbi:MAG: hypothetical protein PHQ75_05695 [Thermoguttaceae bacterium]|nr:hypothetical protein [Thermoguttaceae bacterium]
MFNRLFWPGFVLVILLLGSSEYAWSAWPQNPLTRLLGKKDAQATPTQVGSDENLVVETHCEVPGAVIKLQMAPSRKYLAAIWKDVTQNPESNNLNPSSLKVSLWDVEFNHSRPEAPEELSAISSVFSTAFDSQSERFFVADASQDRPVNQWGLRKSNIRVFEPGHQRQIQSILSDDFDEARIRLSQDAHWIACLGRDGNWSLIDRDEPKRVVVFPEIEVEVASESFETKQKKKCCVTEILAFSPRNDFVATLVSDMVPNNQQSPQTSPPSVSPLPTEPKPEEQGVYRTIVIWDLLVAGTLKLEDAKKLPLEAIKVSTFRAKDGVERRRCAFSSDSTMIAVRSKSKYVGVWQTANGQLFAELGEHEERITSLAISPNNLKLVVGTGQTKGRLVQWDIRKETIDRIYEDPDPEVTKITAVTFSPDGYTILFGTDTGVIKSWQVEK